MGHDHIKLPKGILPEENSSIMPGQWSQIERLEVLLNDKQKKP